MNSFKNNKQFNEIINLIKSKNIIAAKKKIENLGKNKKAIDILHKALKLKPRMYASIIIFPSYYWHGTVPYNDNRVSISTDYK